MLTKNETQIKNGTRVLVNLNKGSQVGTTQSAVILDYNWDEDSYIVKADSMPHLQLTGIYRDQITLLKG